MANITETHPSYAAFADYWQKLRDAYSGEDAIKRADTAYLFATEHMNILGMTPGQPGYEKYKAYRDRAVYPELVKYAVEVLLGSLWTKPPVIELPTALEAMLEDATLQGETLEGLLMRIHEQQLVTGRVGLLLDIAVDNDGKARPYIAVYDAETIINWDEGNRDDANARSFLNLVVLNETAYERNGFKWELVEKYRVLVLGDPTKNEDAADKAVYTVGVFRQTDAFDYATTKAPVLLGTALEEIPFVFINSKDVLSDPDRPPLLGLANRALTIYRGEADYRQNLFMQSQDTLVVIGSPEDPKNPIRVGAGATIHLPVNGDAKYVGVSANGLAEQRSALEGDYGYAATMSGQLLDTVSREKESAEALNVRIGAKTASLKQIATTSAAGLEKLLKIAARWIGANEDEVSVKPNLDFADVVLTTKTLVELQTFKTMGGPIARETIHAVMKERGLTELTYEEEVDKILEEEPLSQGSTDMNTTDPTLDPNGQPVDNGAPGSAVNGGDNGNSQDAASGATGGPLGNGGRAN